MSATTEIPPTGVSNSELIRWAFGVLNTRSVQPLRGFWTDATVERFPQGTRRGEAAIAEYFEEAFAALPDFNMEIIGLAEQNDDVFVHWKLTGTHSGAPFQGIEATGRSVAIDGIDHFVVRDGTVESNFVVYDQMQFARQIGLIPEDGTRADRGMKAAFNTKNRVMKRVAK
jgi:predicted ester cyclase